MSWDELNKEAHTSKFIQLKDDGDTATIRIFGVPRKETRTGSRGQYDLWVFRVVRRGEDEMQDLSLPAWKCKGLTELQQTHPADTWDYTATVVGKTVGWTPVGRDAEPDDTTF